MLILHMWNCDEINIMFLCIENLLWKSYEIHIKFIVIHIFMQILVNMHMNFIYTGYLGRAPKITCILRPAPQG